jgi:hypothetical protein
MKKWPGMSGREWNGMEQREEDNDEKDERNGLRRAILLWAV